MSAVTDAVVIGGGLHGLSAALHLARRGVRVTLFERDRIGRHASGATAAGVRILNRDPAEIPLALVSNRLWRDIGALVGDDCGFHAHGMVRVAEHPADLAPLRERAALVRGLGYDHEEMIDAAELFGLVPALARHCAGALICRRDGAADPHRTLAAFRRAAEAAGVVIHEGAPVSRIVREEGCWRIEAGALAVTARSVVNAAGAWGGRIGAMLGEALPLRPKALMMIVTEKVAPFLGPVMSIYGRKLSFKQTDRGTLLLGGGHEGVPDLETGRSEVRAAVVARGAKAATDLFPAIGPLRVARIWAGIEAATADALPIIERSPRLPDVVHAVGFTGHGFQLVPVVGGIVADLVIDGGTALPIAPFAAARFAA
ncbi:FAD-binding oxidoreductase [Rhodovastum atsumiense]|uniref:FAD-binding oxidoreductase n=1 Tax=Rhodovastum atsumiense TaxID=504468 RepID=A0A5M6IUK9_9PROT|nr:FAD-dependent oxidoreductase [Rhodovastum atsumiense]KAA5611974.1 FAD-binding oxidoreductase [Rhodovastum atsumiense]CAH2598753.1 FAD-binding oxidoreductase [Rhodovastum atsumiense]